MEEIGDSPIKPFYAFNAPGEPIQLYQGSIGGLSETEYNGVVEFTCEPKIGITWQFDPGEDFVFHEGDEISLTLHRESGDVTLSAWMRGASDGWSNGGEFGDPDARISHVVAHWFNLPNWIGPLPLSITKEDGYQKLWSGRWPLEIAGWKITFDTRHDHSDVWRDLHKSRAFIMTHVMELARIDGRDFSITEAKNLLSALHMGISFALGRFVAPMLPVGLDADGIPVWESWRANFCDPARSISSGLWYYQDLGSLENLLECVVGAFSDSSRLSPLRLQLEFAISAIKDEGFVEQRITIGNAGLEHLLWQELVLTDRMSKNQYEGRTPFDGQRLRANDRLRILAKDAGISLEVDPSQLPAAAEYVAHQKAKGIELDGVDVITRVRNKITHPQGDQDEIYRWPKLVTDVWMMTRHYLSHLILYSLGFSGSTRNMMKHTGWVGEVEVVPWRSLYSK